MSGTIILVMVAKGYNFNFKTREVVQNGLVLIGSEPVSASIILDNNDIAQTTPHRMTMSSGQHTVGLKRSGYRDWRRSFELGSGEVLWLSYPLLLPKKLASHEVSGLAPGSLLEPSSDSSRIALSGGLQVVIFRSDLITLPPQTIDLAALVPGLKGNVTKLSWSDSSSRLMVEVSSEATKRYLYLEIADTPSVTDLSSLLNGYSDIRFAPNDDRDFYGLRDGSLWQIPLDTNAESPRLIAESVDKYNAFEQIVLTWSAQNRRAVLHLGSRSVVLDVPPINNLSDLSISRYNDNLVVGLSGAEIGTYVIESPGEATQRIATIDRAGTRLLFSPGATYLMSHDNGRFQIYDFERRRFYSYDLAVSKLSNIRWATGAHLLAITEDNKAVIFDFDGQNFQILDDASAGPIVLSPDQEHVIHISKPAADGQLKLIDTNLLGQ